MADIDDTIKALEDRLKQAKARKEKLEARKLDYLIKGQRADDTRKKILVGSAILDRVNRGEWPESRLLEMLDKHLTRPHDRALFGLKPIEKTAATENTESGE